MSEDKKPDLKEILTEKRKAWREERIETKRRKLAEQRRDREAGIVRESRFSFDTRLKIAGVLLILVLAAYVVFQISDYMSKRTSYRVTDEGFTHDERFENAIPLNGIDISEHQDPDIQWKKVKTSGVDYVFIRAGYRAANSGKLHEDKYFRENIEKASKAGLMTGVYFYSQALNADEGKEEADFVLDLISKYDITLLIIRDIKVFERTTVTHLQSEKLHKIGIHLHTIEQHCLFFFAIRVIEHFPIQHVATIENNVARCRRNIFHSSKLL